MALQASDVKIFQSIKMDDTDSGGGESTVIEIPASGDNNIFDDVSPLNRVFGAVHLRKVYPSVFIQTQDKYYGSHTILSKIPKDEQVNICLFSTKDHHDLRPNATSRVESYVGKTIEYSGTLFGTAFQGSNLLTLYQPVSSNVVDVSDVLHLQDTSSLNEQYIKVENVTSEIQQFTVDNKTFTKLIVSITITQPLDFDFEGNSIQFDDNVIDSTLISQTAVVDSAKYYSTRPLDEDVLDGSNSIKADSIFTQLIPNTRTEIALLNKDAQGITQGITSSLNGDAEFTFNTLIQNAYTIELGAPVAYGTLNIATNVGAITDKAGSLIFNNVKIGILKNARNVRR